MIHNADPTCGWCKKPASAPGLNARGERCPCRCHSKESDATDEDPYHVARFTGGEP